MSERKRLIELLSEAPCGYMTLGKVLYKHVIVKIADYLLEHSVIIPPVKIGDTVYGISRGVIIPIIVDKILYSNDGIDFLGRNEQYFGRSFIHIDVNNGFGIEWYKTKEEAEKQLKGGAERNG